jgi:hypothetical protein
MYKLFFPSVVLFVGESSWLGHIPSLCFPVISVKDKSLFHGEDAIF